MNKKKSLQNNSGFIALTSVLLLSSFIVLLLISVFETSVGEMRRTEAREYGEKAVSLANTCAEKALNELSKDSNYQGDESFSFEEGSCEILSLEENGENGKIIRTKGVFSSYERKMIIEVDSSINIIKWEDE